MRTQFDAHFTKTDDIFLVLSVSSVAVFRRRPQHTELNDECSIVLRFMITTFPYLSAESSSVASVLRCQQRATRIFYRFMVFFLARLSTFSEWVSPPPLDNVPILIMARTIFCTHPHQVAIPQINDNAKHEDVNGCRRNG